MDDQKHLEDRWRELDELLGLSPAVTPSPRPVRQPNRRRRARRCECPNRRPLSMRGSKKFPMRRLQQTPCLSGRQSSSWATTTRQSTRSIRRKLPTIRWKKVSRKEAMRENPANRQPLAPKGSSRAKADDGVGAAGGAAAIKAVRKAQHRKAHQRRGPKRRRLGRSHKFLPARSGRNATRIRIDAAEAGAAEAAMTTTVADHSQDRSNTSRRPPSWT